MPLGHTHDHHAVAKVGFGHDRGGDVAPTADRHTACAVVIDLPLVEDGLEDADIGILIAHGENRRGCLLRPRELGELGGGDRGRLPLRRQQDPLRGDDQVLGQGLLAVESLLFLVGTAPIAHDDAQADGGEDRGDQGNDHDHRVGGLGEYTEREPDRGNHDLERARALSPAPKRWPPGSTGRRAWRQRTRRRTWRRSPRPPRLRPRRSHRPGRADRGRPADRR